jgi:hypothetical protein
MITHLIRSLWGRYMSVKTWFHGIEQSYLTGVLLGFNFHPSICSQSNSRPHPSVIDRLIVQFARLWWIKHHHRLYSSPKRILDRPANWVIRHNDPWMPWPRLRKGWRILLEIFLWKVTSKVPSPECVNKGRAKMQDGDDSRLIHNEMVQITDVQVKF